MSGFSCGMQDLSLQCGLSVVVRGLLYSCGMEVFSLVVARGLQSSRVLQFEALELGSCGAGA